ncbi:MAG: S8 family serine peptidase [Planctomycetota bacterium]|jgi:subtilisin family serine protease|nr:S8 family serine peptidase [Planctomycetota bacterium]MDP6941061.1 S8 family serine peptidase [Planctomycetota bacterium]
MLLSPLFALVAGFALPVSPIQAEKLFFHNGSEEIELRVDGSSLGVRFDSNLSESEVRVRLAQLPLLASGVADTAIYLPGKTVYLDTQLGTSPGQALELAETIRSLPGVLCASPRLWALEDPYYLTEEILVRWLPDAPAFARRIETEGLTQTATLAYSENPGEVFRVPHGSNPLQIANKLAQSGFVEFAIPDFQLHRIVMGGTNDPIYPDQWHLESTGQNGAKVDADIDVEEAWDTTRGLASVTIAVIDTGVELNHPDLRDHLLQGIDVLDNDNNPKAEDYLFGLITENHSTSVCGVAAGHGNNNEGISGVSQESGIIPIRFLSEWILNQPTLQDEADAFNFANSAGAAVVNNSWGPSGAAPLPASTRAAIDDIVENGRGGLGSVVFFAAGNSGSNNSSNGYTSYPRTVSVTACTDQETLASYSSFGASTYVCAPSNGGINDITTTDRMGGKGYSAGDYTDSFGGTSSASPCAAGVMLLLLSANPSITGWEATATLLGCTDKIDQANGNYDLQGHSNLYGYGRVNAALAVSAATRIDSVSLTGPATSTVGSTITLDIAAAPANSDWTLFWSWDLGGSVVNGFHPLDLSNKAKVLSTGQTDSTGSASWLSSPLPAGLAGRSVYLEALVSDNGVDYDSNPFQLSVQ